MVVLLILAWTGFASMASRNFSGFCCMLSHSGVSSSGMSLEVREGWLGMKPAYRYWPKLTAA
ncbi:hypothetical protein M758_N014500 [Ceratodon purpureus]|nr:hypothetical protein M758_N014500 [Ceratodon purpureus]